MIFCPKCGKQLPDEAVFCAGCGAKIVFNTAPEPEPVVEPIPEPVPEPVVEPIPEPVVEPIPEPIPEPVHEPVNYYAPRVKEEVKPEPIPEPKPSPVEKTDEKPVRRPREAEPPLTPSNLLAVAGFAMAFISPVAAIILSALAKAKVRKKRSDTFTNLANWGLFLGIVFTTILIVSIVMSFDAWKPYITDFFH